MSSIEVQVQNPGWVNRTATQSTGRISATSRRQILTTLVGTCLMLADAIVVGGGFMLAYVARFSADENAPTLGIEQYIRLAVVLGVLCVVLLATHGLYELERPLSWPVRLRGIVSSTSTALVLAVTASYFLGDQAFSRLWLAVGWVIAVSALAVWRAGAHRMYEALRDAFAPLSRVLIVGANRQGQALSVELKDLQVVGYVDNGSDLDDLDLPLLGTIAQLEEVVQAYAIDELVIALPSSRREQVSRILTRGFRRYVRVNFVPEFDDMLPKRFYVQELGGRRFVGFVPVASVSWIKRAIDLVLVSVGLIVLAPVLVLIAAALKLDSPGPVFFRQQRVGKNGRHFSMLKFRSMCLDADRQLEALRARNEATGPLFKMRSDPRVTRVGRILRRWSLDELPQLLNVLRGEMSLVGPRPPLPSEVEKYEDWELGRLRAVPGLTGLWQVSGRSEVPFHDMIRLDLHYIRNWSLALDLEILLRTVPAVLTSRGAY